MKTLKTHLKREIDQLADLPGVYRMLDKEGNLLYIGKSIHIKQRVASYFAPSMNRNKKIHRMVRVIDKIDVTYTDTELDALLLECKWIQEQKPPYNTLLTRSGRYRYLEVEGPAPYKLKVTQRPHHKACLRIGPLPHKKLAQYGYRYVEAAYKFKIQGCDEQMLDQLIQDLADTENHVEEKLKERMAQHIDNWAFEEAQKTLEAMKGIKYMKYIYRVTTIALNEQYIGKMPLEGSKRYKYYAISGGQVIKMLKAYPKSEDITLEKLKKHLACVEKKDALSPDEIDQVLLIEAFKHKRMEVLKV
ncbi:MAG: GIY-YIG nuclease family protein [Cellulosilyticaceae bacterium]